MADRKSDFSIKSIKAAKAQELLYLPCKNGLNTTFKPFLSIIFLVNEFIYTRYCLTITLVAPVFASVHSRVSFSALYV